MTQYYSIFDKNYVKLGISFCQYVKYSDSNKITKGRKHMDTHSNNQVTVVGHLASGYTFSHESHEEKFYSCTLAIERTSGTKDYLPIIVSEKLIGTKNTYDDELICVIGQIRSYNQQANDKRHLLLYLFAFEFYPTDSEYMNEVCVEGYVCKEPTYRVTPYGRKISDLIIAIPRCYGKSDYIPFVCWGRNAVFASQLEVGQCVSLSGRMQSREYQKCINDVNVTKIAYEVSVNKINIMDRDIQYA